MISTLLLQLVSRHWSKSVYKWQKYTYCLRSWLGSVKNVVLQTVVLQHMNSITFYSVKMQCCVAPCEKCCSALCEQCCQQCCRQITFSINQDERVTMYKCISMKKHLHQTSKTKWLQCPLSFEDMEVEWNAMLYFRHFPRGFVKYVRLTFELKTST